MYNHILSRVERILIIMLFIVGVYTPFIVGIVQPDKGVSGIEKRNLAKFPDMPKTMASFVSFPAAFDNYYADNFGLREVFIKRYFKFINKHSKHSAVDDVTVGKNGWLFLGSVKPGYQRYSDPIGDAMNVNLFSEKQLAELVDSLVTIQKWLAQRGIEYVYVIAPNKHTIYFDQMPDYITKKNEISAQDQLVRYLREHTDINVVDLRPVLMEERKKHLVFFKTDTHWNHYGANVAQYEIMKVVERLFPGEIEPTLLSADSFKVSTIGGGDLAGFAKIDNVEEINPQPIFDDDISLSCDPPGSPEGKLHTMTSDAGKLKAVIFRDSFFSALHPYFSRKFHRTTYVKEIISCEALVNHVEKEKPDVVIEEFVERKLPYVISVDAFK